MSANKFLIENLDDFSEQLNDSNLNVTDGITIVESEDTTYKYGVSHLSDSINVYDNDAVDPYDAIADAKAVHDYIHALSTSLSDEINSSTRKLTDGKAVHDYIHALSTSLSGDISSSVRKFTDAKAVHDYIHALSTSLSADISAYDNVNLAPFKIADAKAVHDYIKYKNFLGPDALEGLGIDDLKDLVNMIQSLLNDKNLYLFVHQEGVRIGDVYTKDKVRLFDVVQCTISYYQGDTYTPQRNAITPIWKNKPDTLYGAQARDIIFFKTIDDAVQCAQLFKFLAGSQIVIYVCSDLIMPVSYNITDNNTIAWCRPIKQNISHSERCVMNIYGARLEKITYEVVIDRDSNSEQINNYSISANVETFRTLYYPACSMYNPSYFQYALNIDMNTFLNYLIIDRGVHYETESTISYINVSDNGSCTFNNCAFLFTSIDSGSEMSFNNVSFSNVDYCMKSKVQGKSIYLNDNIEILSCYMTPILVGPGQLHRVGHVYSLIYCETIEYTKKKSDQPSLFFAIQSFGYAGFAFSAATDVIPDYASKYYVRVTTDDTYTPYTGPREYYSDVQIRANNTLSDHCLPANSRIALVYQSSDGTKDLVPFNEDSSSISKFLLSATGINELGPGTHSQYTPHGYIDYSLGNTLQYQMMQNNIYNNNGNTKKIFLNYVKDRLTPGTLIHNYLLSTGAVYKVWSNPYYRNNYDHPHLLSADLRETSSTIEYTEQIISTKIDEDGISKIVSSLTPYYTDICSSNYKIEPINYSFIHAGYPASSDADILENAKTYSNILTKLNTIPLSDITNNISVSFYGFTSA